MSLDRSVTAICLVAAMGGLLFGYDWVVKDGFSRDDLDAHPEKLRLIDAERDFVMDNLHAEALRKVFSIARIQYGRADFALVNGRIQVYEINTNPNHASAENVLRRSHPGRRPAQQYSEEKLQAAITGLDCAGSKKIQIGRTVVEKFRRRYWSGTRTKWRP